MLKRLAQVGPIVAVMVLLAVSLAAVDLSASDATARPAETDQGDAIPVSIRFAGTVGEQPLSCAQKYDGIGTTGSTIQIADLRFYISSVRLVRADGSEVPVQLTQDGLWQHGEVALLDFEDGSARCANGTPETRYVVEGTAPRGEYARVRFAVGLPFDVNHREVTLQPSPLNLSRMFWSWNGGYKFLRLDLRSTGQPMGWMVHLGSTGCRPAGSPTTAATECKSANQVVVDVPYRLGRDEVRLDVKSLLASSNVDTNQSQPGAEEKSAGMAMSAGCMSGPMDPDCAPLFERFGLPLGDAPARGSQQIFSTRPATTTVAAPQQ